MKKKKYKKTANNTNADSALRKWMLRQLKILYLAYLPSHFRQNQREVLQVSVQVPGSVLIQTGNRQVRTGLPLYGIFLPHLGSDEGFVLPPWSEVFQLGSVGPAGFGWPAGRSCCPSPRLSAGCGYSLLKGAAAVLAQGDTESAGSLRSSLKKQCSHWENREAQNRLIRG